MHTERPRAIRSRDPRLDPVDSAHRAGLHYVSDERPGIRRERRGKDFVYVDAKGAEVRRPATLRRIRSLAIPPAWTDVWICADPDGHLQATGRDARGRKQYRYHPRFREARDEIKYERLFEVARSLPRVRARVDRALAKKGLSREKVLAGVVRLLDLTLIRVGNEEYTRLNHSFGLTTFRNRHARIHGSHVEFRFRGKSGIERQVGIADRRLARLVRRCQELPGEHLFEYVDREGNLHAVGSHDVNEYLRTITGKDFTAKDFRTWAATVLAAVELHAVRTAGPEATAKATKKELAEAVRRTAQRLGNTPSVCRKCYIHPAVIDAYTRGHVLPAVPVETNESGDLGLRADEKAVLAFLKRLAAQEKSERAPGGLERSLEESLAVAGARKRRDRAE